MDANTIRQKFLDFQTQHGHTVIQPAPLVLENDPTTLFTGSGMQPLLPYLLGKKHPEGNGKTRPYRKLIKLCTEKDSFRRSVCITSVIIL